MRNICLNNLSRYKKIFLVNSKQVLKKKKLEKDSCTIYINDVKDDISNSYVFSWSEFPKGYYKRCRISKKALKFSLEFENILEKENLIIFKLLKIKFPKNLISLVLKKFILNNIYEYLFLFYCAKELKNKNNVVQILNYSPNFNYFENRLKLFQKEKFLIFNKKFFLLNIKKHLKSILLILFYQIFSTFFSSNITLKKYRTNFAIKYYVSGFNLNTNPKLNWIFRNVKKKDYHIVCEQLPADSFIKKLKINKINYIVNSNIKPIKILNLNYIPKYLFSGLLYILIGLFSFFRNLLIVNFAQELIVRSIKWEKFTDSLMIDKYVSNNNYDLDHIVRNFFLRKFDTKTFHYKHTFAENIYEKTSNYSNYNYAYAYYDYEFHWSSISKQMSIIDKSQSKKFIINGPIDTQYEEKKFKKQNNLICFFTTQLGTRDSVCGKTNHIKFLNFIKKFSENKRYKIILKPKYKIKNIKYSYPEIYKIIVKLKNIKNIQVIENIASEELMFSASKIISMPFASTSIQGIFKDIPSYYLDLDNQFKNIF